MSETSPTKRGVLGKLVDISGLSVGIATFLIALLIAYDVIARSMFRMTTYWVTEVSMYLMAYITFVGAAYALKEGAHVRVDMFVILMRSGIRRWVIAIADLVLVVVVAILAWLSFVFFQDAWLSNEVSDTLLAVKLWIPYLVFFGGMVWLLVILLVDIRRKRAQLTDSKDLHD